MDKKTILIVDDDQGFIEPLGDALEYENHKVLKASTVEEALRTLEKYHVDLVTVDIMMHAGPSLDQNVDSHYAGVFLCEELTRRYRDIDIFCISVVTDPVIISKIKKMGVRFFPKGETSLRTILDVINSKLKGFAYTTASIRDQNES